jgi:flavin reductase (DIM6/NTAB) family NADH-FMN oxidoreductase RutF
MSEVKLSQTYRLLNHSPTVLIFSKYNGKPNIMAAAWNMPLDFAPL